MKKSDLNKPQSGDYVEVSLIKKEYKGILLEVPKDEKGIILLKLDSGYNIGFNKKDILDVKVVEKASLNSLAASMLTVIPIASAMALGLRLNISPFSSSIASWLVGKITPNLRAV